MDGWTPICLPKFDPNGFLHGLVSYLAPDCEACLVMFSVDRGAFFNLLEAKKKITDVCIFLIGIDLLRTAFLMNIYNLCFNGIYRNYVEQIV